MESIILKSGKECDAGTVIAANGFIDVTPEISLFTNKRFVKDRKTYKFAGWDHVDKHRNWQDIRMEEFVGI